MTPGRPEFSERAALAKRHEELGGDGAATWILKPSDGSKGAGIQVLQKLGDIDAFLDALEPGTIAWVVSEH